MASWILNEMSRANHKLRTEVRVALSGGRKRDGVLFTPRGSAGGAGSVLELLNGSEAFLPFEESADGITVLLNRSHIQWVSLFSTAGAVLPQTERFVREELVQVDLCDGLTLKGLVLLELGNPTHRASDFLNGPIGFLRLVTPDAQFFINKAAVIDMIVFETSPVPELEPIDERCLERG